MRRHPIRDSVTIDITGPDYGLSSGGLPSRSLAEARKAREGDLPKEALDACMNRQRLSGAVPASQRHKLNSQFEKGSRGIKPGGPKGGLEY